MRTADRPRLASNSLLEAMVFGVRAADDVRNAQSDRPADVMPWYAGEATSSDEAVVVTQNWGAAAAWRSREPSVVAAEL